MARSCDLESRMAIRLPSDGRIVLDHCCPQSWYFKRSRGPPVGHDCTNPTLPIFRPSRRQGVVGPECSLGSRRARALDLHCDRQDRPPSCGRSTRRARASRHRPSSPSGARHAASQLGHGRVRHPFEGVPLEVRAVPAVIECRQCSMHTELDDPIFRCGACGSTETTVVSGDELFVTSLDLTIDA